MIFLKSFRKPWSGVHSTEMFSKDFGTNGNWVEGKEVGGFLRKRHW
jgi:hypothetical protein